MQWLFYEGYTVPYMCCSAVYQGVGFGENFQLKALHLGDSMSISQTGSNCSTEISHQLSLNLAEDLISNSQPVQANNTIKHL